MMNPEKSRAGGRKGKFLASAVWKCTAMASVLGFSSCSAVSPGAGSSSHGGKLLVCLDPGHPSPFSSGAISRIDRSVTETHIDWMVANQMVPLLKARGIQVMLTKSSESQNVDNQERTRLCNEAAAKFLRENPGGRAVAIHLHCDSSPSSGFGIYYPDQMGTYKGPTGHEPNQGYKGPSVGVQQSSHVLAQAMEPVMRQQLAGSITSQGILGDSRTLVGGPGHQGALTFSIFSQIPTVTIEMVVLDNARDLAFIRTSQGQQKMAEAITAALKSY